MISLPKLLAAGLLSTATEVQAAHINSLEAATLLSSEGSCPMNGDTCLLSWNRLLNGNNNEDYNEFSAQSEKLYKDPTFPAGPGSLFWPNLQKRQGSYSKWVTRTIPWARPSEMQKSDPSLWASSGEIRPAAAQQGGLGDCWFLAAASALAEYPDRIKKLYTNTAYSNTGVFQTKWNIMGEEVRVTIDDRLPVNRQAVAGSRHLPRTILSRKSPSGSWWLPLLEKAFAKVNVNYANLSGGWMVEAWRQMTGQPVFWIRTKHQKGMDADKVWSLLSEWDAKKYVISTACFSGANGLVAGHAYTIIGVKEITLADGTKQKLVKARNPWGSERYKGKWSDRSKYWTEDTKRQAGLVVSNDGTFFVPVEEFLIDFQELQYIAYKDDWKTSTVKLENILSNKPKDLSLKVTSDKPIILVCDQSWRRHQPSDCKSARNTYAKYSISNEQGQTFNSDQGNTCQGGTKSAEIKLPVGDYKIRFTNHSREVGNYALSTYSEDEVSQLVLL